MLHERAIDILAQVMPPPIDGRFILILVIVLVALLLIFSTGGRRRSFTTRTCGDCGAAHPGFARFCRRCGKRL